VFGLVEIVALPVSEMGLTPNRVFRTQYLPLTFNSTTPIVWNLIVVRTGMDSQPVSRGHFTDLVLSVGMAEAP
jgi:hypothetical protein